MTCILRQLIFFVIASPSILCAGILTPSTLTLANTSDHTIFAAFYHQSGAELSRASKPIYLPKDNDVTLTLPSTRFPQQRVIMCSLTRNMPIHTSVTDDSFLTQPVRVGIIQADHLTYFEHQEDPSLWPTAHWQEWRDTQNRYHTYTHQFAHAEKEAKVSTALMSAEDRTFHAARALHAEKALRAFLGEEKSVIHAGSRTSRDDADRGDDAGAGDYPGAKMPRIGLCCTGGGFRATTATAGFMHGLEAIGLFDGIRTVATLSGSCWTVAAWLAEQCDIATFSDHLATRVTKGIMHSINEQYHDFMTIKEHKELCGQTTSAIDFYGLAISYTLLKPFLPNHTRYSLSNLATASKPERNPLPLFTAATRLGSGSEYHWLTFSPYSICAQESNCCIPAWSLGRTFSEGKSTNNTPPPMLGYFLGMFGSAFSVSFRDALERAPDFLGEFANKIISEDLHRSITQADWANKKISPACLPNFAYAYEGAQHNEEQELAIFDGVYKNNLPLLPLLRHHDGELEAIIILDSQRIKANRSKNAQRAWDACGAHGFKLPPLATEEIENNSLIIMKEPGAPTIIYVTLEPDLSYDPIFNPTIDPVYATPNFYYPPSAYAKLVGMMYHVATTNKGRIREALKG